MKSHIRIDTYTEKGFHVYSVVTPMYKAFEDASVKSGLHLDQNAESIFIDMATTNQIIQNLENHLEHLLLTAYHFKEKTGLKIRFKNKDYYLSIKPDQNDLEIRSIHSLVSKLKECVNQDVQPKVKFINL